jgi:hypothetical protein
MLSFLSSFHFPLFSFISSYFALPSTFSSPHHFSPSIYITSHYFFFLVYLPFPYPLLLTWPPSTTPEFYLFILIKGTLTRDILAFFIIFNTTSVFSECTPTVCKFLFCLVILIFTVYFKFSSSSIKILHNLQFFNWIRLEITQACLLNTLEHSKCYLWTCLGYFMCVPWTRLGTVILFLFHKPVQITRVKLFACSEKVLRCVQWNSCKLWSILPDED